MKLNKSLISAPELRLFAALLAVLLCFLLISLAAAGKHREEAAPPAAPNPFADVRLTAKAAYVYDVKTGTVLYDKNGAERLPLASLTKVMSALVATRIASPETEIPITKESLATEGDSGLVVGERFALRDLINFSLTMSSNDGMHAIALALGARVKTPSDQSPEAAFVRRMNETADELGLKNTYYLNETGLDLSTSQAGAYGSAEDMATLFAYVLAHEPGLLSATNESAVSVHSSLKTHLAVNTDIITNIVPGLIGGKTGYTDLAGGNLVIAFDPEIGRPIVVSVLGSTEKGRFRDVETLVNASFAKISTVSPLARK